MPELNTDFIKRAANGDSQAFGCIVKDCQAFAYSVSYRLLGNTEDAEDAVQEAFLRLWKHLPKYRFEVKLTTWLYRIIVNLCLDYLKSAHRKHQKNALDSTKISGIEVEHLADDPVHHNELHTIIQEAASGLTPRQKAVFILRDLEELSVAEVCSILDMSEGNVKSNLYYARKHMCEKLKQYYQTSENPLHL